MKFYHGTTKENWKKIQKEGVLWGVRDAPMRCTYLAVDKDEAKCYGDIILEIEYTPKKGKMNNYIDDCWQFRVYEPIPTDCIKLLP